jgi:hypothetical protein
MGVSMAGMLTGRLEGDWIDVWLATFVAATIWLGFGAVRELASGASCRHPGGHLTHLVGSAVMLYMLIAMRWAGMGAAGGHLTGSGPGSTAMPMGGIAAGTPLVALVVAALLVADAAVSAGRMLVLAGPPGGPAQEGGGVTGARRRPLAPRGTAGCLLVMSLAMAFMIVRP